MRESSQRSANLRLHLGRRKNEGIAEVPAPQRPSNNNPTTRRPHRSCCWRSRFAIPLPGSRWSIMRSPACLRSPSTDARYGQACHGRHRKAVSKSFCVAAPRTCSNAGITIWRGLSRKALTLNSPSSGSLSTDCNAFTSLHGPSKSVSPESGPNFSLPTSKAIRLTVACYMTVFATPRNAATSALLTFLELISIFVPSALVTETLMLFSRVR